MRGQHLPDRSKAATAELAGHGISPVQVGINYANKPDSFALLFELFVDASMVASEHADADDCYGNRILCCQKKLSMAGCREDCKRKRSKEHPKPTQFERSQGSDTLNSAEWFSDRRRRKDFSR